jgi:hypothetical protein
MKVYIAVFQESEQFIEPFRMFFASKKELHMWSKENYDKHGEEHAVSIDKVNIPTDKKGLIAFLNIYFPEGGG